VPDGSEHPILAQAWSYEIVGFNLQLRETPSRLDLTLRSRGSGQVRRLRFLEPRDVFIENGFRGYTDGLSIRDVRARKLEGLTVQVTDFEASNGAIGFWARDVIDLDATP
jgi:hypothetical protein